MHILTKIFIVLTSLLSVALVPLVMLNTANEDTFKKRWLDEQARAKAVQFERDAQLRLAQTDLSIATSEKNDLKTKADRSQADAQRFENEVSRLTQQLVGKDEEIARAGSERRLREETDKITSETTAKLFDELKTLRGELTAAREENNSLDHEKALLQNQNEVLTVQNRRLKEEVDQVRREKAEAQTRVTQYVAMVGELPAGSPGAVRDVAHDLNAKVPADRALSATILDVRRGAAGTIAEINAGSRDGVQPGWSMTIADGGKFIGNLRITTVDVNRSVGTVELEDPASRGEVARGMRVMSRKGE